jgi:hypothetical protein
MPQAKKKKAAIKKSQKDKANLQNFILEQWQDFSPSIDQYQWPWENARWHELAFCIILKFAAPRAQVPACRQALNMLVNLNLLHIPDLAKLLKKNSRKPQLNHPDIVLILSILQKMGISIAQARAILTTLCEAAHALQKNHSGKVQRYLRHYGEQMLREIKKHFAFTCMSDERLHDIFTLWLQNVLNMPIGLNDAAIQSLCKRCHATVQDLSEVADDLDINIALLDDMAAAANQ